MRLLCSEYQSFLLCSVPDLDWLKSPCSVTSLKAQKHAITQMEKRLVINKSPQVKIGSDKTEFIITKTLKNYADPLSSVPQRNTTHGVLILLVAPGFLCSLLCYMIISMISSILHFLSCLSSATNFHSVFTVFVVCW